MKIIFVGTPLFAVPALERLLDSHHQVACVVTQPDRPSGRGQRVKPSPVKGVAQQKGLPVLQPEKLRGADVRKQLAAFSPDVIVVVSYGKILPPEVLAVPRLGCLNIHASLLPKYRGAAPIAWAIINGGRKTGVTIMLMDEGMDTGPIVAQTDVEILDDDDALSLGNTLSVLGADLLMTVLDNVERDGRIVATPQDHSQATRAPLLKKSDGDLDWSMTSEQIICRMHGLRPWPGCFSKLGDTVIRLIDADCLTEAEFRILAKPQHEPGEIVHALRGRGPVVRTGDGYIVLTHAQPASRNPMRGADLLNGGYVKPPMRFERLGPTDDQ